jgi:CubicO group peptidase (beta-lactamase class C family)
MNRVLESPESVGCSSERLERIQPMLQSYVNHKGYAGLSILLARRGRLIHCAQAGWQERESRTPLTADTIFRIYSMTKPVVCTAFMTLYEQGRFQLLDPVAKYLPAFGKLRVLKGATITDTQFDLYRPITIRDLLTHTAGLTYGFLEDSPVSELYRQSPLLSSGECTLEAQIEALARIPLAYQPGMRFHYSLAIDVIGHLIEVISGLPLADFLKERLFIPLGMTDTAFYVPPEKRSRLAAMYGHPDIILNKNSRIFEAWQKGINERIEVEKTYPSTNTTTFARGGYGLFSTAWDYMRFAQMLLQRGELDGARILAPKIVDLMHRNHLPPGLLPYEIGGMPANGYGFGLGSRVLMSVSESALPGSAGEFGWSGAANTYYWVDPQEEIVGILMAQYMVSFETPEKDFQVLAYASVLD